MPTRPDTGDIRASAVSVAVGPANHDALIVAPPLFGVADGADDSPGAAQRALDEIARCAGTTPSPRDLFAAVRLTNWRLWQRDGGDVVTTATLALWDGDRIVLAHAGDSRALLVRNGRVRTLTDDLTVDPDAGDADDEFDGPLLGRTPGTFLDVGWLALRAGDRLVLCTDGVWRVVDDDEWPALVTGRVDTAASRLESLLRERAAEDASAVVLAPEPEDGDDEAGRSAPAPGG